MTPPSSGRPDAHSRPRRPDPRPPRTRRAILQAGHALMVRGGLEAATVSAIADAAHVAVGSIYAHFPGKEALVIEVFIDRAEPALREFMAQAEALGPQKRLEEAGAALVRFSAEEPALTAALVSGRLLTVSGPAEEPRRRLVELGREAFALLDRDLVELARIRGVEIEDAGPVLLTFLLGLMSAIARTDALAISAERASELLGRQLETMEFLHTEMREIGISVLAADRTPQRAELESTNRKNVLGRTAWGPVSRAFEGVDAPLRSKPRQRVTPPNVFTFSTRRCRSHRLRRGARGNRAERFGVRLFLLVGSACPARRPDPRSHSGSHATAGRSLREQPRAGGIGFGKLALQRH